MKARGISLTEILISWEEVPLIHQNGIIISYEVQYESLEFTGLVDSTNLSLTLDNLQQDTEYNISVRARTVIGFGPPSNITTVRTLNGESSFSIAFP